MANTTYYNLEKPSASDFYAISVANANADKIDAALHTINAKASRTRTQGMLYAANWQTGGIYSFENTYPHARYDVDIELASCTSAALKAFEDAKMVGDFNMDNEIVCLGTTPTVDIPIIITVTDKTGGVS